MTAIQAMSDIAPAVKYQPKPKCYYFDVALGSILLSGEDTGGAYCLLDLRVAPGLGVPRHTHTREDEAYFVLSGERHPQLRFRMSSNSPPVRGFSSGTDTSLVKSKYHE